MNMEWEEAYYYFAVFLKLKKKQYADYDEGTVWEAFWSGTEIGKTNNDYIFDIYPLHMELRKRLNTDNYRELKCPKCGGELKFIPPSDCDVDVIEIRCQKCKTLYEVDVEWA